MNDIDDLLHWLSHRVIAYAKEKEKDKCLSTYIDLLYKSFGVNKPRPAHVYYQIAHALWKANNPRLAQDYVARVPPASYRMTNMDKCTWNDVTWLKSAYYNRVSKYRVLS